MKKLTLAVAFCAALAFCAAPIKAQAKNVSTVTTFAVATTNATEVFEPCGAFDGEFVKYNTVCVSAPNANTGTVWIAVDRAGTYVTVASVGFTNTTSASVQTVDLADIPVNGRVRYTFKQTGAKTNTWSALSFFEGLN